MSLKSRAPHGANTGLGRFLLLTALIAGGLILALWRMHSAEEQVTTSRHLETVRNIKPLLPLNPKAEVKESPVVVKDVLQPRVNELQQILDSKNDNDPRLDTDFKVLSEPEKKAFQAKYLAYAPEKLNERGTLAFLIGRNIKSKEDLEFLQHILDEKPCQSLANCNVTAKRATGEAAHTESINSVTLAYPQIVSIKSLENILFEPSADPTLKSIALQTLTEASHSKSAVVANLARQTIKKLSP